MLACLPMYDLPELRAETDAWWSGLAAALRKEGLRDVPERLSRGEDAARLLRDPTLLLAQTCGFPLTHDLADRLSYLASPCYAAPGCSGSDYCSFLLVREEEPAAGLADLKGRRLAINAWDSQSGMNVLRLMVAPFAGGGRFFSSVRRSGGHRASLALLRAREADLAAVDCVTHALVTAVAPWELEGLRCLVRSPAAPSLPYVTARAAAPDTVARLRAGLLRAAEAGGLSEVRARLLIAGIAVRPETDYDIIPAMAAEAVAAGYPRLQ